MVKPGDKVKIFTQDEVIEGMYLEKPKLLKQDTIIVKLSNGYNIGIDKHKIREIKIIEEYVHKGKKKKEIQDNKELPTIAILSTGGTISSKVDYNTGGVIAEYTAEDFVEMCPELREIANIKSEKIMEIMSEDVVFDNISLMAEKVHEALKKYDGVVLTTGTDMLGYISAGLSFALDTSKPVIITAAQKSIDRGSSDAFFNLICAVNAAANMEIGEVAVCMHGESSDTYCSIIRGVKARKMHTSARDAFKSVNTDILAKVFGKGKIEKISEWRKGTLRLQNRFEKDVSLVYIYPGIKEIPEHKGIIIMGTGLGHVPITLYPKIKELVKKGCYVGITSQCLYGRVSSTVYSGLREISSLGAVHLEDMLPETALMKLSWCLANSKEMLENYRGEINERHTS